MNEIKQNIELQITRINKEFYNFRGKLYYEELEDEDIETLENLLVKVSKNYKSYRLLSIISNVSLFAILMLSVLDFKEFGNLKININLLAFIVMLFSIIISTYRFYKVKVNLEHKIFLLKLKHKLNTAQSSN